jgi:hypothetical protein
MASHGTSLEGREKTDILRAEKGELLSLTPACVFSRWAVVMKAARGGDGVPSSSPMGWLHNARVLRKFNDRHTSSWQSVCLPNHRNHWLTKLLVSSGYKDYNCPFRIVFACPWHLPPFASWFGCQGLFSNVLVISFKMLFFLPYWDLLSPGHL